MASPSFSFSPDSTLFPFLKFSVNPVWHRGMRNEGCSQLIAVHLCHSFLTLLSCSSVVPLPWDTVFHENTQCGFFSGLWFFKIYSTWIFSTAYRPSATDCFSMGPHEMKLLSENFLLHGISPGCSFLHGLSTCSSMEPSMGCRWICAPT